jgi:predicted RNase H-like HicB family nuclease
MDNMKKYMFVLESAGTNWATYVPDLPGCVATSKAERETMKLIRHAVEIHVQGTIEDGLPIPEPICRVDDLEIAAETSAQLLQVKTTHGP